MSSVAFAASCCPKAKTFFFAVVARHIWGFAGSLQDDVILVCGQLGDEEGREVPGGTAELE